MLRTDYYLVLVLVISLFFLIFLHKWWSLKELIGKKSYCIRKSIFSVTEYKFYFDLNEYFIKKSFHSDYFIFTKIRMIDIFYPTKDLSWNDNKNYLYIILSKHIDFIITDKKGSPILLIEFDDKYHKSSKYYKSDKLKDDISKFTWIPLLRFNASNFYNYEILLNYL